MKEHVVSTIIKGSVRQQSTHLKIWGCGESVMQLRLLLTDPGGWGCLFYGQPPPPGAFLCPGAANQANLPWCAMPPPKLDPHRGDPPCLPVAPPQIRRGFEPPLKHADGNCPFIVRHQKTKAEEGWGDRGSSRSCCENHPRLNRPVSTKHPGLKMRLPRV